MSRRSLLWRRVAAGLLLAAVLLLAELTQKSSAQGVPQRLQQQAEASLHRDEGTSAYSHMDAVCDTGNGTMLYIVTNGQHLTVKLLPNGCQKAQAER